VAAAPNGLSRTPLMRITKPWIWLECLTYKLVLRESSVDSLHELIALLLFTVRIGMF
jgi:hypothetical protein